MVAKTKKSKTKLSIKPAKKITKGKKIAAKPVKKSITAKSNIKTKIKTPAKSKLKNTKIAAKTAKSKSTIKNKVKSSITKPTAINTKIKKTPKNTKKKSMLKIITPANNNHVNLLPEEELNFNETAYLSADHLSGPSKFKPYNIDHTEDYMNEQQLQHFAKILESWKQELMLEVDHTITEMKEADILADPNDRATQEETFNLELRTRDRERKLIKKIESALNKISEQKYGYCDSCGVEIGIRRLEARPTATLCIECKTLAEIREKRS